MDSSLQSDTSQISYPAQQDGSGGEEEEGDEDTFLEPLREYPRYRKLQDLNRCAAVPSARSAAQHAFGRVGLRFLASEPAVLRQGCRKGLYPPPRLVSAVEHQRG